MKKRNNSADTDSSDNDLDKFNSDISTTRKANTIVPSIKKESNDT